MSLFGMLVIAVALSMDAFAVSVCKGLSQCRWSFKNAAIVGLYFGGFQGLMPLIGYLVGYQFQNAIRSIDHWIAFILLGIIGISMIKESLNPESESCNSSIATKDMLILAVATSIDALAVGVTFAFLQVNIIPAVSFIGIITFALSIAGMKAGTVFGYKYKSKAEFAGGIILIFMGFQILIEHLFF